MFVVILQLLAIGAGLWLGAAMGLWWVALGAALFFWLLALLVIGTARFLLGPHTVAAKRFGEF
jgi:hypothetical protein